MAEGSLYRRIRLGDASVLLAAAIALGFAAGDAHAASTAHTSAADPSVVGRSLVFQRRSDRGAVIDEPGAPRQGLPGTDPALSKSRIAVIQNRSKITILRRSDRSRIAHFQAKGAHAVALDATTIAYRTRRKGSDRIYTRGLRRDGDAGSARLLAKAGSNAQLGRPFVEKGRSSTRSPSPPSARSSCDVRGRARGHCCTVESTC